VAIGTKLEVGASTTKNPSARNPARGQRTRATIVAANNRAITFAPRRSHFTEITIAT
jgi:hypothetical protein